MRKKGIKRTAVIKAAHFTLRPLKRNDAVSIVAHINDKEIARNLLTVPYPYTINDAYDWLRRTRNNSRRKKPSWVNFAIDIDGETVGIIGLFHIAGHKAEIGYWLGRTYWGRGIMTRVVRRIVRYGFDEIGLRRIYAHVFTFNKASMRVLEKAGFKFEGELKKNVKKGDRLLDEYVFAKVR